MKWSAKTYSVTNVPKEVDFSGAMQTIFGLDSADFKVHSLAWDASDQTEPDVRVATVSFRTTPALLQPAVKNKDGWSFELPIEINEPHAPVTLHFDDTFLGFTPLTPLQISSECPIE